MPLAGSVLWLGVVMATLGLNMGAIDNITNLAMLRLQANNVPAFIQTMHFFYGVGAFLTPIVVRMFLNADLDFTMTMSSNTNAIHCYDMRDVKQFIETRPYLPSISPGALTGNRSSASPFRSSLDMLASQAKFTSQTRYAFWILAVIQLPAPLILLALRLRRQRGAGVVDDEDDQIDMLMRTHRLSSIHATIDRQELKPVIDSTATGRAGILNKDNGIDAGNCNGVGQLGSSLRRLRALLKTSSVWQLTLLMSALVFLLEGLMSSHGAYIFSYAMKTYDGNESPSSTSDVQRMDTKAGATAGSSHIERIARHHRQSLSDDAYITVVFWAFFSLGRLVSIYAATKFSASFMLLIDCV